MRTMMLVLTLLLALAGTAWAQGYEYQLSGLEYETTVPVAPGEDVQGLLRLASGMTALGQVRVAGVFEDDLFAYWTGTYGGENYYYDVYSGYWKPGPVDYRYATLDFQGEALEGWVRQFGVYLDTDHFFGRDGVLYSRVKVLRGRTRDTNRRRQVVYSYFVNMATGERSDGEGMSYRYIGDSEVAAEVVEQVMQDADAELAELVEESPAYPQWETEAYQPPAEVAAPSDVLPAGEQSLLELIEAEIGPLTVAEVEPETAEATAADGQTDTADSES